ncbi:hypothetical protein AB0G04_32780 [Actinoplanes sp. NPDC023801]|uniref:hypothetical protein n=1 Tax=Actinoplanes sp. NPDC023801 TaxID=3154595 RepID=UPI0033E7EBCE
MKEAAENDATVTAGGERLSLRRHSRRAFDALVVEGVLPTFLLWAVVVIVRSGPVDYRWFPALAGITAAYWALLVLPAFVIRLVTARRTSLTLSRDGIEGLSPSAALVRWQDVAGVRAVRRLTGRRVQVTKRGGASMLLHAPRSGWLPDPRFERDLAALREWAVRHGAPIDPGKPHPREPRRLWSPMTIAGLVLVALLVAAGLRTVDRGVVWPWTPIASGVTGACPALEAAGLGRHWPADTREHVLDETRDFGRLHLSECRWHSPFGTDPAPFDLLVVTVARHGPGPESSAVASAARSHDAERAAMSAPRPLTGVGDEAVVISDAGLVVVAARKANVTVVMWANLDSHDRAQNAATSALRVLTTAMMADVRLDSTERRGDG